MSKLWHKLFGHGKWVLDLVFLEATEYTCMKCGAEWTGPGLRQIKKAQEAAGEAWWPRMIDKLSERNASGN